MQALEVKHSIYYTYNDYQSERNPLLFNMITMGV